MKTALVTGASRGRGQAMAVNLLGRGYKVHGTFNHSEAEARELERAYEDLTFHQADFSDRTSTNQLTQELAGERFDAIVNNAGIFEMEDFSDFDFKIWDHVIEVNLSAPLIIAMSLRDQINEGGAIVNVSSLDGLVGSFASMAYSARPQWTTRGDSRPYSIPGKRRSIVHKRRNGNHRWWLR